MKMCIRDRLTTDEVKEVAEYLKMEEPQFVQTYLEKDETEGTYLTKNKPCDFLQKNGECLLEECKPDGCKKYPYTCLLYTSRCV